MNLFKKILVVKTLNELESSRKVYMCVGNGSFI